MAQFIMQWDQGKDSFAIDPPNATISVLGGSGSDVADAVVTLKSASDATTLTFDVTILEGTLNGATGPAALFIDFFAARYGGFGGFHGVAVGGYRGGAYWHAPGRPHGCRTAPVPAWPQELSPARRSEQQPRNLIIRMPRRCARPAVSIRTRLATNDGHLRHGLHAASRHLAQAFSALRGFKRSGSA